MIRGSRWDALTRGLSRRSAQSAWHDPERLRSVGVVLGVSGLLAGVLTLESYSPAQPPAAVASGSAGFAFMAHQPGAPGTPVTYSPCEVIDIEVNEAAAPPDGRALLEAALRDVSAASGLDLRITGSTDDLPGRPRVSSGFPGDWDPVLVAWATPDQAPELAGDVAGVGGSVAVGLALGARRYVTGTVALDAPALAAIREGRHGRGRVVAVLRHELAHLVGLAHVDDPTELMYERSVGVTRFGPGDRAGLAALGAGSC